jgi:hypothetical protein
LALYAVAAGTAVMRITNRENWHVPCEDEGRPARGPGTTLSTEPAITRASLGLAIAALFTLAACSEQPTATAPDAPDASALFAKGRGGNGSPHFSTDGTSCTFATGYGRLACDYQVSGLASNSSGIGTLVGNVMLSWDCNYSDSSRDYSREVRRVAIDFLYYADAGGNAKGHVEDTASGSASCFTKYIGGVPEKPEPANLLFSLSENSSPFTLPYIGAEGSWALYALVTTPKKGPQPIFWMGSWTPEPPPV